MLVRPDVRDLGVIGLYVGRILTGLGCVMALPAVVGLLRGEINDALGFVIGGSAAVLLGQIAEWRLGSAGDLQWSHAMAVVALSWVAAAFVGAVPLFLSGHYLSFLDAYFDAMSGFATAGLAVINDLDHVSDSVNVWRHLMQFLGGQGLALVALSMFAGAGGLTGLYVGEAREERIVPNVRHSAQVIWSIALLYAGLGITVLYAALLLAGMPAGSAVLHAATLFMAAFDTGGFAPTSASLGFYHSALVEAVAAVLMVGGALSFAVHYRLFRRRAGELVRNSEIHFLVFSIIALFALMAVGLVRSGTYDTFDALWRRGGFQLLSAHTGTGFGTVPNRLFATDWGTLAPGMLVIAMALGGMAGSTTGGIKALRVTLAFKGLRRDLRKLLLPTDAVTVASYYTGGTRRLLRNDVISTAVMILLLYVVLYFAGALLGLFYGYSIEEALFESTSAAAAVGLSVGIVGPEMPIPLKVMYVFQMWIGRLEFISVFALFGYVFSLIRGRT